MKHFVSTILLFAFTTVDVNAQTDCEQFTDYPLMVAVCEQDLDLVKELVENENITYEQYDAALIYSSHIFDFSEKKTGYINPDFLKTASSDEKVQAKKLLDENKTSFDIQKTIRAGFVKKLLTDPDVQFKSKSYPRLRKPHPDTDVKVKPYPNIRLR